MYIKTGVILTPDDGHDLHHGFASLCLAANITYIFETTVHLMVYYKETEWDETTGVKTFTVPGNF